MNKAVAKRQRQLPKQWTSLYEVNSDSNANALAAAVCSFFRMPMLIIVSNTFKSPGIRARRNSQE